VTASEHAAIRLWRCDSGAGSVGIRGAGQRGASRRVADWTLVLDDWLFHELNNLRSSKLPNETGGVLLGAYDLPQKTVYVVDTIPSPPDSEEWPTLYIRGSEGLRERVADITEMTVGQLEYVGEWHSHPDGCSCRPSNDDIKVFSWMTDRMSAAGLPALMAIVAIEARRFGSSERWNAPADGSHPGSNRSDQSALVSEGFCRASLGAGKYAPTAKSRSDEVDEIRSIGGMLLRFQALSISAWAGSGSNRSIRRPPRQCLAARSRSPWT